MLYSGPIKAELKTAAHTALLILYSGAWGCPFFPKDAFRRCQCEEFGGYFWTSQVTGLEWRVPL